MTSLNRLFAYLLMPLLLVACGTQAPAPPLEGAQIGGPFTLTDKTGEEIRWADFDGQYRIIYFGYTFCPDACPMDVEAMMKGFRIFEQAHPVRARKVQPIFVSIDPERDTPEVVGEFAAAFHPRLLGLTGTPEQIAAAADAFVAIYSRGEGTGKNYLMDHSRNALLMGPSGEPIALLPVDEIPAKLAAAKVAAELEKWVK